MARSAPSASAMPRVSVVFPAALSPAMASMTGRGGSGAASLRRRRIILSGTVIHLPGAAVGADRRPVACFDRVDELPPYDGTNQGTSPGAGEERRMRPAFPR